MPRRRLAPAVLCALVLALQPFGADAIQDETYQPDIRVATVKSTVDEDGTSVKATKFKGNGTYESTAVTEQELIVAGAAEETETFLVMVENDGSGLDQIRFKLEVVESTSEEARAATPYKFKLYEASRSKGTLTRGDNVTKEVTSDKGVTFELKRKRARFYWLEVTGRPAFAATDTARFLFVAKSIPGSKDAIQLSSSPTDTMSPIVRDQYVTQFGEGIPPEDPNEDDIDLSTVAFVGFWNISQWEITAELESVTITDGSICLPHSKQGQWSSDVEPGTGATVEGNLWIVAWINNTWHAGIFEWYAPSNASLCVTMGSNPPATTVATQMANHLFFEPMRGYIPVSGETVYMAVSALAWPGQTPIYEEERTRFVEVIWP